jgi:hypothetical protein
MIVFIFFVLTSAKAKLPGHCTARTPAALILSSVKSWNFYSIPALPKLALVSG